MADFTALLSSIVQAASTGVTLAGTLHDAGDALVSVEKRLHRIDRDIDLTARALAQLGAHLEDPEVQALVSADTVRVAKDAAAECTAIFKETEAVVAKIKETGSTGKEPYQFREAKMDVLRANLGRVEGNLELLSGVIVHGRQMSTGTPDPVAFATHREAIGELMAEKEESTQKYLALKFKYDAMVRQENGGVEPAESSATANGADAPRRSIEKTPAIFRESSSNDAGGSAASSAPSQLPSAFLASLPPSPYPDEPTTAGPAPETTNSPPPATASGPADAPADAPATKPRSKFASAAKKTAHGAGVALSVTFAVILYPAAITELARNRRRRKFREEAQVGTGTGGVGGKAWTREDDNALLKDGTPLRTARLQQEKWEREQAEKAAAPPEWAPMRYVAKGMRGEVVGAGELGDNADVGLVDWVFGKGEGEGREAPPAYA